MEPPSSDAEALPRQETAQIRASNGLLVTANELRHLERDHQSIRQSVVRLRRVRRQLRRVRSMRRFRVRLPHRYPPRTCGVDMWSTPGSRIDEPSRDHAAEGDRPKAIGLRGRLGKAGFRTQDSTHRSSAAFHSPSFNDRGVEVRKSLSWDSLREMSNR